MRPMSDRGQGRPQRSYEANSVRSRLMDLLTTCEGEWMTTSDLVSEYSERFGEVNPRTLRRTLYRIMERREDVGKMWVRYKPIDNGRRVLEILVACEEVDE